MNWVFRILGVCVVGWLLLTSDGQDFINSLLKGVSLETDVTKYDCQMVADLVKGEELQNAFGMKSKILKLENLSQTSKTSDKIMCDAMVTTSTGKQSMEISVEKAGSNEIMYFVQPK